MNSRFCLGLYLDIYHYYLQENKAMNQFIPEPPAIEGLDLSDIVLSCRAEGLLQEIFGQPRYIVLEICISEWIKVVE